MSRHLFPIAFLTSIGLLCLSGVVTAHDNDPIARLQSQAIELKAAEWGHWGPDPARYSSWTTHSNRLIPLYLFGGDLSEVSGSRSVYRDQAALEALYGFLPTDTLNPQADYFDQTDVYRLQKNAIDQGKKRVILFVFDGMDWQTTQAAAIASTGKVQYQTGRGTGLIFQDYRGAKTDYGYFVTSPHNEGTTIDVDSQKVKTPGGKLRGGYSVELCGPAPWGPITDALYPIGKSEAIPHAYTDSAASATSMTCGIKSYNDAINVDPYGREVESIARMVQKKGYAVGVVTSVPISHATPACAYANNVHRDDYQDLTRDLLGLPSVFHPEALSGVDVLIGCGWGETKEKDGNQGSNFVPGNRYLTEADLKAIDYKNGGHYVVAQRTQGQKGIDVLKEGVQLAREKHLRLFGYYGVEKGHLPFQTANGQYDPVASIGNPDPAAPEVYSKEDLSENVTLRDMAVSAIDVLQARSDRWWLMVEAGDVDWANHSNNIDNSIGAVISGDDAFRGVVEWIENHGGWDETVVMVTADHGHYLVLDDPEMLTGKSAIPAE